MEEKQSFIERYMTPIAVVLGAIIIAFALAFGHGALNNGNTGAQQGAAPAVDVSKVKTQGEPYTGDENAPVTMAFWFDYQCPFCKQFDEGTFQQVYDNYVKTGKMKVVFKSFQFLGNDSIAGAEYGYAVWNLYPDQFYAWYQDMFKNQDNEGDVGFGNQGTIDAMVKKDFAGTMDAAKIDAYITQNKAQLDGMISADRTEGASFGINGTPAMIIGKTLLSGAQPYDTVSQLIDAQLAGK